MPPAAFITTQQHPSKASRWACCTYLCPGSDCARFVEGTHTWSGQSSSSCLKVPGDGKEGAAVRLAKHLSTMNGLGGGAGGWGEAKTFKRPTYVARALPLERDNTSERLVIHSGADPSLPHSLFQHQLLRALPSWIPDSPFVLGSPSLVLAPLF